jgi:tetratricopeptide (TPR) repeat protein
MDLLRPLLMMFYAPGQALRTVRDRAPLAPALLIALIAQAAYLVLTQYLSAGSPFFLRGAALFGLLSRSITPLLFIALVFVPVVAFIANLLDRRGRFGLVLQQEYAALASSVFYAWAAANLLALPLALLAHASGFQDDVVRESLKRTSEWQQTTQLPPDVQARLLSPQFHAEYLFLIIALLVFALWMIPVVRQVFRLSAVRSVAVLLLSGVVMFMVGPVLLPFFGGILALFASPFMLLLLFFLLRGYIGEVTRGQRARTAFRQNLEAATLNPADASAHYNLGLIHQQRGELEEARERFHRAIEIDPEELDAHYQLGRIARAQGGLPEAVAHFEQVVSRDQTHAQHEIWREIGATYLAAGQYEDARDALERFLDHRQSDPEGLYLMGRAHAGLGHQREAAASMQACIEAVKTAPAYKYRTEKRWLNEAQQFLKTVMSNE